jgi:hypothetical protein
MENSLVVLLLLTKFKTVFLNKLFTASLFIFFFNFIVLHEAVCTGDPELVQSVLQHRDYQRYSKRTVGVPELLQKLKEVLF